MISSSFIAYFSILRGRVGGFEGVLRVEGVLGEARKVNIYEVYSSVISHGGAGVLKNMYM